MGDAVATADRSQKIISTFSLLARIEKRPGFGNYERPIDANVYYRYEMGVDE